MARSESWLRACYEATELSLELSTFMHARRKDCLLGLTLQEDTLYY